jgi:hypothetical protein
MKGEGPALSRFVRYLETFEHSDSFKATCVSLCVRAEVTCLQMGKIDIDITGEIYEGVSLCYHASSKTPKMQPNQDLLYSFNGLVARMFAADPASYCQGRSNCCTASEHVGN